MLFSAQVKFILIRSAPSFLLASWWRPSHFLLFRVWVLPYRKREFKFHEKSFQAYFCNHNWKVNCRLQGKKTKLFKEWHYATSNQMSSTLSTIEYFVFQLTVVFIHKDSWYGFSMAKANATTQYFHCELADKEEIQ